MKKLIIIILFLNSINCYAYDQFDQNSNNYSADYIKLQERNQELEEDITDQEDKYQELIQEQEAQRRKCLIFNMLDFFLCD